MRAGLGLLAVAGLLALGSAATASAAVGDLSFRGCLANDASQGCGDIVNAPLDGPTGVAVSPDGRSVYVASGTAASVSTFDRAADGSLSFRGCIADDSLQGCVELPNSPLEGTSRVAVSPDGGSVYLTAGFGNSVSHFSRSSDGGLTFQSCIADDATDGCANNGDGAPLTNAAGVTVRPNGNSVYVAGSNSQFDNAISRFSVGQGGQLTFAGCIASNAYAATNDCSPLPGNSLVQPVDIEISPDGNSLYVSSPGVNSITRLAADGPGALSFADCVASGAIAGCADLPDEPMSQTNATVISPDGASAYAVGRNSDSLAVFDRGAGGPLAFDGCLADAAIGGCADLPNAPLNGAKDVVVSPDGASVYVAGDNAHAISTFTRAADGALAFAGCAGNDISEGCADVPSAPLTNPGGLAVSPDGASVYVISTGSDSIAEFARETPPAPALTLDLTAKKKQRVGKLAATATCSDPCTVELQATGKAAKKFSSKLARDDLGDGETAKLKLKLKRKTLRKVDDEKGKATITGTATDDLGRTATDKVKLKLRP